MVSGHLNRIKQHPVYAAAAATLVCYLGLEGIWSTFTTEPMVPVLGDQVRKHYELGLRILGAVALVALFLWLARSARQNVAIHAQEPASQEPGLRDESVVRDKVGTEADLSGRPDLLSDLVAEFKVKSYKVNGRPISAGAFMFLLRREFAQGIGTSWLRFYYQEQTGEPLSSAPQEMFPDLVLAGILANFSRPLTKDRTEPGAVLTELGRQFVRRIQNDNEIVSEIDEFLSVIPRLVFPTVWSEASTLIQDGTELHATKWFVAVKLVRGPESIAVQAALNGLQPSSAKAIDLVVADGQEREKGLLLLRKGVEGKIALFAHHVPSGRLFLSTGDAGYLTFQPPHGNLSVGLSLQGNRVTVASSIRFAFNPASELTVVGRSGPAA